MKKEPLDIRFWRQVKGGKGCWDWQASRRGSQARYGQVWCSQRQAMVTAHRVAWELKYGPVPVGMCVLHKCDRPICVRPSHLFLGTQAENVADRDRKGRRRPPWWRCPTTGKYVKARKA